MVILRWLSEPNIQRMTKKRDVQGLTKALKHKNCSVRSSAAAALGEIGEANKQAITALIKALKDEDCDVTQNATYALSNIGPAAKAAIPALIQLLEDKQAYDVARMNAAYALSHISPGDEKVVRVLIKMFRNDYWMMRTAAGNALEKMGRLAVPALIDALKSRSQDVKDKAVEVLAAITGHQFGGDRKKWRQWWRDNG